MHWNHISFGLTAVKLSDPRYGSVPCYRRVEYNNIERVQYRMYGLIDLDFWL